MYEALVSVRCSHTQETDEEFDSRYERFFNRPDIDGWEIRKAVNDLQGYDLVPEPKIVIAAMKACRRVNDYALAVRFLEAVKVLQLLYFVYCIHCQAKKCTILFLHYLCQNSLYSCSFWPTSLYKKLIRRSDSERELSLRRQCTRTKNTIDSCINSATDRFLQRRFTKFNEIKQCNGHYAIQGHSRSPISVPIESSYTTSY